MSCIVRAAMAAWRWHGSGNEDERPQRQEPYVPGSIPCQLVWQISHCTTLPRRLCSSHCSRQR